MVNFWYNGILLVLKVIVASLRGIYFGVFDGHGGPGAALMVADQLINHLQVRGKRGAGIACW